MVLETLLSVRAGVIGGVVGDVTASAGEGVVGGVDGVGDAVAGAGDAIGGVGDVATVHHASQHTLSGKFPTLFLDNEEGANAEKQSRLRKHLDETCPNPPVLVSFAPFDMESIDLKNCSLGGCDVFR